MKNARKSSDVKYVILKVMRRRMDKYINHREIVDVCMKRLDVSKGTILSNVSKLSKEKLLEKRIAKRYGAEILEYTISLRGLRFIEEFEDFRKKETTVKPKKNKKNKKKKNDIGINEAELKKEVLTFLNSIEDWTTSAEVALNLDIRNVYISKINKILFSLCKENVVRRKRGGGAFVYKAKSPITCEVECNNFLDSRINFLLRSGVEPEEIDEVCYEALRPLEERVLALREVEKEKNK